MALELAVICSLIRTPYSSALLARINSPEQLIPKVASVLNSQSLFVILKVTEYSRSQINESSSVLEHLNARLSDLVLLGEKVITMKDAANQSMPSSTLTTNNK